MTEENLDLQAKRKAVRAALAANAKDTERHVFLLPRELVSRLLDYQLDRLLPSEVAAARELLDAALTAKGFPPKDATP